MMVSKSLIFLIKMYKFSLSPFLGRSCRFDPSCSTYASQSIEKHGVFRGLVLAIKRIGRCHPWGGQGYDPVND